MSGENNVAEVVPAPAVEPVKEAPELVEKPAETEDSFVEESLGPVPEPKADEVTEEEETTPEPEAQPVAPAAKKEEAPSEPVVEEPKEETPESPKPEAQLGVTEAKVSRLDRRVAQKYAENYVLRGQEVPSADVIEEELAMMTLDEKKNALRNLLDENRSLRGQKEPVSLSQEDEEAIIEAEVERRYQQEQIAIRERDFQVDLAETLAAHPELDSRTKSFNPKLEKAVAQIVQSGVFASEAYSIITEALQNAKEDARKQTEIEKQKAMSGAVIASPVSEPINKEPETDEDKFVRDAIG